MFNSYIHQSFFLHLILMGSKHKNWRRQWHPIPVLLLGKSHGQRSLVGCSPWVHEESDTTERLSFHFSLFTFMHWRSNLAAAAACLLFTCDSFAAPLQFPSARVLHSLSDPTWQHPKWLLVGSFPCGPHLIHWNCFHPLKWLPWWSNG